MKKFIYALAICLLLVGCESTIGGTKYKEGTFEGSVIDTYNNENNTASAIITVDDTGKITDVFLDTTYTTSDGVVTTKKTLGDDYNMKKFNSAAAGEWYEQVAKLEAAIVEKQGLDGIVLDTDGYTDAVSGCTIKIDALYKAVQAALDNAKK